jgi:hypothetical protein
VAICGIRVSDEVAPVTVKENESPSPTVLSKTGFTQAVVLRRSRRIGEGDPRLFAARPDMPGRLQPRRIVERPGADADHTAARQAVDPTRTVKAHEPSVKPPTVGHALMESFFSSLKTERAARSAQNVSDT